MNLWAGASVLHLLTHQLCEPELWPRIVIELTEHVPIEDYAAVHASMASMRERGSRLAADDLGAGYAGFRHLIRLQPDIIKLDISLVRGIHRSKGQRALASALVAFAADVGARVIAEGVEEPGELDALRDIGVPWAQGFFLGRPVPLPDNPACRRHRRMKILSSVFGRGVAHKADVVRGASPAPQSTAVRGRCPVSISVPGCPSTSFPKTLPCVNSRELTFWLVNSDRRPG